MHALRRTLRPDKIHKKEPKTVQRDKPGTVLEDQNKPALMERLKEALHGPVAHSHHGEPTSDEKLKSGKEALDEIFKWIKFRTAELLDEVNERMLAFNKAANKADEKNLQDAYDAAVRDFKNFVNSLNDETAVPPGAFPPDKFAFGPTINAANITPLRDGDGFYTSVKIVVQWQGGTHSDSTVTHVP